MRMVGIYGMVVWMGMQIPLGCAQTSPGNDGPPLEGDVAAGDAAIPDTLEPADAPPGGDAGDALALDSSKDGDVGVDAPDVGGSAGFPRDEAASTSECPQLTLPVSDDLLAGSRPPCALPGPGHTEVVDAAGEPVAADALIGQPTVLWFFPAPLTPG